MTRSNPTRLLRFDEVRAIAVQEGMMPRRVERGTPVYLVQVPAYISDYDGHPIYAVLGGHLDLSAYPYDVILEVRRMAEKTPIVGVSAINALGWGPFEDNTAFGREYSVFVPLAVAATEDAESIQGRVWQPLDTIYKINDYLSRQEPRLDAPQRRLAGVVAETDKEPHGEWSPKFRPGDVVSEGDIDYEIYGINETLPPIIRFTVPFRGEYETGEAAFGSLDFLWKQGHEPHESGPAWRKRNEKFVESLELFADAVVRYYERMPAPYNELAETVSSDASDRDRSVWSITFPVGVYVAPDNRYQHRPPMFEILKALYEIPQFAVQFVDRDPTTQRSLILEMTDPKRWRPRQLLKQHRPSPIIKRPKGGMEENPASYIVDEAIWEDAKRKVIAEHGRPVRWALVMYLYKKMGGRTRSKSKK